MAIGYFSFGFFLGAPETDLERRYFASGLKILPFRPLSRPMDLTKNLLLLDSVFFNS